LDIHVKTLGALNIAAGALGLLISIIFFLYSGLSVLGDDVPLRGIATLGLMLLMAVLFVPMVVIGLGLVLRKPWSRTAGTVLAILGLLHFPLGTAVSFYGLWVLLSPDVDEVFSPRFRV
jgi:hypothetical protein